MHLSNVSLSFGARVWTGARRRRGNPHQPLSKYHKVVPQTLCNVNATDCASGLWSGNWMHEKIIRSLKINTIPRCDIFSIKERSTLSFIVVIVSLSLRGNTINNHTGYAKPCINLYWYSFYIQELRNKRGTADMVSAIVQSANRVNQWAHHSMCHTLTFKRKSWFRTGFKQKRHSQQFSFKNLVAPRC